MMWGKWLPKTGYGPWPIDGGRTAWDGNRLLGDGKDLERARGRQPDFWTADGADGQRRETPAKPAASLSTPSWTMTCQFRVALGLHRRQFARLLFAPWRHDGLLLQARRGLKREGTCRQSTPCLTRFLSPMMVFVLGWLLLPGLHGERTCWPPCSCCSWPRPCSIVRSTCLDTPSVGRTSRTERVGGNLMFLMMHGNMSRTLTAFSSGPPSRSSSGCCCGCP